MGQDSKVRLLGVQQVDEMRQRPNVQVVDVRLPFDYFGGRVPGSVNVPGDALVGITKVIPHSRTVILVCDDGDASGRTAELAVAAGFEDVAVLDGGMDAWFDANLPTETISDGVPPPVSDPD